MVRPRPVLSCWASHVHHMPKLGYDHEHESLQHITVRLRYGQHQAARATGKRASKSFFQNTLWDVLLQSRDHLAPGLLQSSNFNKGNHMLQARPMSHWLMDSQQCTMPLRHLGLHLVVRRPDGSVMQLANLWMHTRSMFSCSEGRTYQG